jgi:hypothetical protein
MPRATCSPENFRAIFTGEIQIGTLANCGLPGGALLREGPICLVGKDLLSPVRQIRSEGMELLTVHAENEKAIIILNGADNLYDCSRWNRNGELVIVLEGKYHDRLVDTILHRYLA